MIGGSALGGLAGLALTSHAAGRESYAWAATGVTFLHNAAVALWVGALALILLAPAADRLRELGQFARRALPLATIAILAGVVNAGLIFPDVDTVTATDYGRVLIGKIAIVALVLGLAGFHHMTVRRSLAALPRLMRVTLRLEIGLIAIAVIFASTLALLAPPQVSRGDLSRIELSMPTTREITTDQVFVRLAIDPARTGENEFVSYATQGPPMTVEIDNAGAPYVINHPPLADIQLISVELMSLDHEIAPRTIELTALGDGRFRSEGVNLSADGWWRAIVSVRRAGIAEDVHAEFILLTPDPNIVGFPDQTARSGDDEAEAIFERAKATLAVQEWALFQQNLTGGTGGVELSSQTWSNGAFRIATPSQELIRLNGKRYFLDETGEWRVTDDSAPRGPSAWVEDFAGATRFALGNTEDIDGRTVQAIHFFVPEDVLAPAWYTWWIDLDTGLIVQEAMISRSHYMIQRYDWSAPPPEIVAPI